MSIDDLPPSGAIKLDTKNQFCLFDGKRCHAVDDFVGERYSLVFFTVTNHADVPVCCRANLPDFPSRASLSLYQRMLAPPRGYDSQPSILQAFGFPVREAVLIWPPHRFDNLPESALVLLLQFAGPIVETLAKTFKERAAMAHDGTA